MSATVDVLRGSGSGGAVRGMGGLYVTDLIPGINFMDNAQSVLLFTGLYLVVMGLVRWLRPKEPMTLRWFSFFHNVLMSVASLYLFLGFGGVMWKNFWSSSDSTVTLLTCDASHSLWRGTDSFQYLFALSKIFEWLDTIILILKGKPVFPPENLQYALHVFHHTTVLSIAWFSWRYPIGASWTGPLTNTLVHTLMYAYYAMTELGLPRRFGLFITPLQLTQFYFCLAFAVVDLTSIVVWGASSCDINLYTLAWVVFCYLVFLVMFLAMYATKKTTLLKAPQPKAKTVKAE